MTKDLRSEARRNRPAGVRGRPRRGKRLAQAETPHDTHVTHDQAPVRVGIDSQVPTSMPRAEDDAATGAGNRDTHDRPGSGRDTSRRQIYF